jgi:hypothetical protein
MYHPEEIQANKEELRRAVLNARPFKSLPRNNTLAESLNLVSEGNRKGTRADVFVQPSLRDGLRKRFDCHPCWGNHGCSDRL